MSDSLTSAAEHAAGPVAEPTAEERFVAAYVRRERRERLLFELQSPKRRYRGLDRFCHTAPDLLDERRVALEGPDPDRQPAFAAFLQAHRKDACTLLSPDGSLDGLELPFQAALVMALDCLDAVILVGPDFAYVQGESMPGGTDRYLLRKG